MVSLDAYKWKFCGLEQDNRLSLGIILPSNKKAPRSLRGTYHVAQNGIDGRAAAGSLPAMTLDGELWDNACRWAFRQTFGHEPAPDELRDYQHALAERDATGAWDALPIYARLRGEPAKASLTEPRRKAPRRQPVEAADAVVPPPDPVLAPPPTSDRAPARALLRRQLADGPKPGALVEAAAREAEIPIRLLIVAADALGVRTRRGEWWLPG